MRRRSKPPASVAPPLTVRPDAGLRQLAELLHPGGVFALWSDAPPDEAFMPLLSVVFTSADAHVVPFPNPVTGLTSSDAVYVAQRSPATGSAY